MVDTERSLTALQALLGDNTSGNISPQDARDTLVSGWTRMACDFFVSPSDAADYQDIQSALDAIGSNGGNIYVGAGTYTVTSTLLVKTSRTHLYLSGGAVVQCDGSLVDPLIKPNSSSVDQIDVEGGKWLQTNATKQGVCFDFSDAGDNMLSPSRIESFGTAIKLYDTTNVTKFNAMENVRIFDCVNGIDVGGTQANNGYVKDVRVRPLSGGGGTGVKLSDARGWTLDHVVVIPGSPTGITGISIDGTCRQTTLQSCWAESNAVGLSIASGAFGTVVLGGYLIGNTTDLNDVGEGTVFVGTRYGAEGRGVAFTELTSATDPTGENGKVSVYAKDNGSGKTQLLAIFGTGAAQQIAIEP